MTTLGELKTQAAALLADPDAKTFSDSDLGYFINAGIAELGRLAPQRFVEDIDLVEGQTAYPVRGGTGNLVANPSFESGDETLFDGVTVNPGDAELTGGWEPTAALTAMWSRSTNAKTGLYVGLIVLPAATATKSLYQDIPVNPGATYYVSGWHWKSATGGEANVVQFHTLDDASVVVTTDAVRHDTTAGVPQPFSGSITIPDDGTVAYIRVLCTALSAGAYGSEQTYAFENIAVVESGQGNLVAANALDQIELVAVEAWSRDFDPPRLAGALTPLHQSFVTHSEGGWKYWAGNLYIPQRITLSLDPSVYYLRVRGYAPYDRLTDDGQVTDLSFELEQALMTYVHMAGLQRLVMERDLFTQWQTRAGNTDVSPAALMNGLSIARDEWRRVRRDIMVLREGG